MKVCFWSTTFQSDTQALAYELATWPDMDVLVALEQPEVYAREAIHRVLPEMRSSLSKLMLSLGS